MKKVICLSMFVLSSVFGFSQTKKEKLLVDTFKTSKDFVFIFYQVREDNVLIPFEFISDDWYTYKKTIPQSILKQRERLRIDQPKNVIFHKKGQ